MKIFGIKPEDNEMAELKNALYFNLSEDKISAFKTG